MGSSYTLIAPGAKTTVNVDVDVDDQDYDGWYCIATKPAKCACGQFVAKYCTAVHLILLWPDSDDPSMLRVAEYMKKADRDPHIKPYKTEFGPAVSYHQWRASGRPIHRLAQ